MEPTPAAIPAVNMSRRSRDESPSRVPRNEPKPAPIWAIGPSRPPDRLTGDLKDDRSKPRHDPDGTGKENSLCNAGILLSHEKGNDGGQ